MPRTVSTLTVMSSERVSPSMHRLRFSVADITPFAESPHTDAYVKLLFPRDTMRTYTVHSVDADAGTLAIDFALHVADDGSVAANQGIACAWAATARPGDSIGAAGPGGAYSPDPDAAHHLIVGDSTAIPAVAAAVRALSDGATADVLVEAPDARDAGLVPERPGVGKRFVPMGGAPGEALAEAATSTIAALTAEGRDPADVQVFIHGEAHAVMKRIRPALKEAGFGVAGASISGYWRRGRTEEAFRQWKRENRPTD